MSYKNRRKLFYLCLLVFFSLMANSYEDNKSTKTTLQTPPNQLEINRANMKAFSDIPAAGEYKKLYLEK